MTRLLIVTAVDAEREAVLVGLRAHVGVDVLAAGVGVAAAATYTSRALMAARASGDPYHLVCGLGIGGAFAGRAAIGGAVIGSRSIAADLGVDTPDGFLPVTALGFGSNVCDADPDLVGRLSTGLPAATVGDILTVSTVTGTAARTTQLAERHPDAVAEAMEGYAVAIAATADGLPFVEVRTISNLVGPRDRDAWRIREALAALAEVSAIVGTLVG